MMNIAFCPHCQCRLHDTNLNDFCPQCGKSLKAPEKIDTELESELLVLLKEENVLAAISLYKKRTRCNLLSAKVAVETLAEKNGISISSSDTSSEKIRLILGLVFFFAVLGLIIYFAISPN